MRLLFNANVYGWVMTGLMGKGGKWFLGYSQAPKTINLPTIFAPYAHTHTCSPSQYVFSNPPKSENPS